MKNVSRTRLFIFIIIAFLLINFWISFKQEDYAMGIFSLGVSIIFEILLVYDKLLEKINSLKKEDSYLYEAKLKNDLNLPDGSTLHKGEYVKGYLIYNDGFPYIVGNVVESDSDYIALEYWYPVENNTIRKL